MSESKSMEANKAGGMTRTNRVILIAAFILLAAAIGYAIWRDSAPSVTGPASDTAAAPSDQLAGLEARTQRDPGSTDAWTALGAAKFDPPLPPPIGRPFSAFLTVCSKARNLSTLSVTLG